MILLCSGKRKAKEPLFISAPFSVKTASWTSRLVFLQAHILRLQCDGPILKNKTRDTDVTNFLAVVKHGISITKMEESRHELHVLADIYHLETLVTFNLLLHVSAIGAGFHSEYLYHSLLIDELLNTIGLTLFCKGNANERNSKEKTHFFFATPKSSLSCCDSSRKFNTRVMKEASFTIWSEESLKFRLFAVLCRSNYFFPPPIVFGKFL